MLISRFDMTGFFIPLPLHLVLFHSFVSFQNDFFSRWSFQWTNKDVSTIRELKIKMEKKTQLFFKGICRCKTIDWRFTLVHHFRFVAIQTEDRAEKSNHLTLYRNSKFELISLLNTHTYVRECFFFAM